MATGDKFDSRFPEDIVEELLERLRAGDGMNKICADPRMPDRETVRRWTKKEGGEELAARIMHAREIGYYALAEQAVEDAKNAKDAAKGRLAFDAVRWHLGKLSIAFADKTVHAGDPENPAPTGFVVNFVRPDAER